MEVPKAFASIVAEARKNVGISQSELARRTNLSPQFISLLEAGGTNISLQNALLILTALEVGFPEIQKLLSAARQIELPLNK